MGAQIHSLRCTTAKWKIYFLVTFDAHKMFVPNHFWTIFTKFDICCWRCVAMCGKIFAQCTSTFSALNHCCEILLKYFCYPYEVVRITLPPIFRLLAIFSRNFAEIVAPPSNKKENYLAILKGQSCLEKTLKTASKSTHKQRSKTCSKYTPSNEQCAGLGA